MSNISKSETADAYYKKMTETPVSRLIVTLGIPTTVSMLISGIYNLADTYFRRNSRRESGRLRPEFYLHCSQ